MDLSEVPLLVLEKVRNKWWDITTPGDWRIGQYCAMCAHVRDSISGSSCVESCPIFLDCDSVTSIHDPNWSDYRDEFLAKIIAEIERRA